jgi:hypothetical protein
VIIAITLASLNKEKFRFSIQSLTILKIFPDFFSLVAFVFAVQYTVVSMAEILIILIVPMKIIQMKIPRINYPRIIK